MVPVRLKTAVCSETSALIGYFWSPLKKRDKKGAKEASAKARLLGWKEELAQENEEG